MSCARLSAAADGPARRAAPARRVEHAQCDKLLTVVGRIKSTICEIFPSPEFGAKFRWKLPLFSELPE